MRSGITIRLATLVLIGIIQVSPSLALAQTEAQDAARGPPIELSPAQRQIIYLSVSRTRENQAAPTGFRVSVGAILPVGVVSERLPGALVTMIPGVRVVRSCDGRQASRCARRTDPSGRRRDHRG